MRQRRRRHSFPNGLGYLIHFNKDVIAESRPAHNGAFLVTPEIRGLVEPQASRHLSSTFALSHRQREEIQQVVEEFFHTWRILGCR